MKKDQQKPERFQDGVEPIFLRGGGPCWPLPLTISRSSEGPLDTSSWDTIRRTQSVQKKKENS